jgi:hypothetical protein
MQVVVSSALAKARRVTVKTSGADLDRLADAALCHRDVSSVRLSLPLQLRTYHCTAPIGEKAH